MDFNEKTNEVSCSKCKGKVVNYGKHLERKYERESWDLIESEDYETYMCTKCGYKDFLH